MATLIVSHTGADRWGAAGDGQVLRPRITVDAHVTTAETVVEYWGPMIHHRVNVGDRLDRTLTPADDFSARFEIDMGTAVTDRQHGFSLSVFSMDYSSHPTDVIWVNGTRLEIEHDRDACVPDGRWALLWGPDPTPGPGLSWWPLPDDLITDGVNVVEVKLQGRMHVYGAYISSHAYYDPGPDPDPDPDPCPDCPVAT